MVNGIHVFKLSIQVESYDGLVRGVNAAGVNSAIILCVNGLDSAGSGGGPHWLTANHLAIKALDGTMISSPRHMS